MKVSVVIPTRGDQDLTPIFDSYHGIADEVFVWDNSKRQDLAVYGRYAMIEEARNELILTQDDDCIVSDPQAIVDAYLSWEPGEHGDWNRDPRIVVACNMPPEFRHEFYSDHALVGFGAVFHRDVPERAFEKFWSDGLDLDILNGTMLRAGQFFQRTCDIVFTGLTPRVLVDVPVENLPWATDEDRMYRQPEHLSERMRMLELVRQVRDS